MASKNDKTEVVKRVAISAKRIGGEPLMAVNKIAPRCLYSGFYGALDSERVRGITDQILHNMKITDSLMVIIDLANVEVIDSAVANHLINIAHTTRLFGGETIFCGISAIVAQTMISSGVHIEEATTCKDLKFALKEVYKRLGLQLILINPAEQTYV